MARVESARFDGAVRVVLLGALEGVGAERKHVITQSIGTAALRGYRPGTPSDPTHLVRFKKGKRMVDVVVSTEDGSFRVLRSGRVVATLGEPKDAAQWKHLQE